MSFGISQAVIGLTVVAIGTSLPELTTSLRAAMRHKSDIAIGNIVGSNIFNIFWVLAVTALIRPIPVSDRILPDIFVVILATVLLFVSIFTGKRLKLAKWEGVMFVTFYILYIGYTVARELAFIA
jgi:cation:H+ antiporter